MATYTREELVRDTLIEMGMVDANETPTAEDAALLDRKAQQKMEELYEDGLIPFDLDGVIPARYQVPLIRILAETAAPAYGLQYKLQEFAIAAQEGMKALRRLQSERYLHTPVQTDYF